MKGQTLEQTIVKKIEDAKDEVEVNLFKEWKKANPDERESLHSELRVLDKLKFRLIKCIRGNNNG